jgi:hypothetical protein
MAPAAMNRAASVNRVTRRYAVGDSQRRYAAGDSQALADRVGERKGA